MRDQRVLDRQIFSKGAIIVKEGDEAYSAFLVQSGTVSVFSERGGKKVEYAQLNAGDIFGEMALLGQNPRNASVEAMTDTVCIKIHKDDFDFKLKKSDPTIRAVMNMLSSRLIESNNQILNTKGGDIDGFITLLNEVFGSIVEAMPEDTKAEFKDESFTHLRRFIHTIEKYREQF
jgi:CRP-like cAMP-binding protein